jgi:hypothetical protein
MLSAVRCRLWTCAAAHAGIGFAPTETAAKVALSRKGRTGQRVSALSRDPRPL